MTRKNWMKVALLAVCTTVSGCYPASYSQEFSGRVLDENRRPIKDARVVNLVYRRCGSLGGGSGELLKSSVVATDSEGRYKNHLSGISTFYTILIAGCGSFSFDSVACKAGFQPSGVVPAENAEARLSPGTGWSHVNLPPECSSTNLPKPKPFPVPLWARRGWIYPSVQDPGGPSAPYPDMPVVRADNLRQQAALWLVVSERKDSGSNAEFDIRRISENDLFFTKNYGTQDGTHTTYVFGFKRAAKGAQAIIKEPELDAHATAAGIGDPHIWVEAVGGIKWTIRISSGKRNGGPIALESVTESDWGRLRPNISAFNKKPEQWQYVLCDPSPAK